MQYIRFHIFNKLLILFPAYYMKFYFKIRFEIGFSL